jgi:hypothetical protein
MHHDAIKHSYTAAACSPATAKSEDITMFDLEINIIAACLSTDPINEAVLISRVPEIRGILSG